MTGAASTLRRILPTRRMLAGGFFLALAASAPAQLRLDDVFTESGQAVPAPTRPQAPAAPAITTADLDRDPSAADRLLDSMEADLGGGNAAAALSKADLLAAWLDREAPGYERMLWLRARACEALGQTAPLRELARLYLQKYPAGRWRLWFLTRAAAQLESDGNLRDAAALWRRAVEEKLQPEPAEALQGAALLLRLADGAGARSLLDSAGRAPATEERRRWLLLESLLVQDDPAIPVPQGAGGAFALRRAMLLELRGQKAEAEAAWRAAAAGELGTAERALVAERTR